MQVALARIGLGTWNIIVFLLEELWIIAMVALLGMWAVIPVVIILTVFSFIGTYLCDKAKIPSSIGRYLEGQKSQKDSAWAKGLIKIAHGLVWLSALMIAIAIGPTTSAFVLHEAGYTKRRAYGMDVIFSIVSGVFWCLVYSLGINLLKLAYEFVRYHLLTGRGLR
jgi:beta-lactamase regulating signal transducer with metallopeptidase domain